MQENPSNMKKFLNTNPFKKATRNGIAVYGVSSYSGFLPHEKFSFKVEAGNASKELRENHFLESFTNIVSDNELIPDRTLILLNQDKHHRMRPKRKLSPSLTSSGKKKLKNAAGTRPITEYFTLTKSSNSNVKKVPELYFQFQVEEIVYKLRGDKVKILWIPDNHSELDPLKYVSTVLKSEICKFMENNQDETTESAIKHNIEIFPDLTWTLINERVQQIEKIYMERNEDPEFDRDEKDEDETDYYYE